MSFKRVVILAALIALASAPFTSPLTAATSCPSGPGVHYVSHNPKVCATIRFFCAENQVLFSNECGCGCIDIEALPIALAEAQPPAAFDEPLLPWQERGLISRTCEVSSGSSSVDSDFTGIRYRL